MTREIIICGLAYGYTYTRVVRVLQLHTRVLLPVLIVGTVLRHPQPPWAGNRNFHQRLQFLCYDINKYICRTIRPTLYEEENVNENGPNSFFCLFVFQYGNEIGPDSNRLIHSSVS